MHIFEESSIVVDGVFHDYIICKRIQEIFKKISISKWFICDLKAIRVVFLVNINLYSFRRYGKSIFDGIVRIK